MKHIALLVFLLVTTFHCFSQRPLGSDEDQQKMFYFKKIEKFRKMRNTGKFLTVTGGVLWVGGIVTLIQANNEFNKATTQGGQNSATSKGQRGANAFLLSFPLLGGGIPLWIVGAHAREKYERKLRNLTVGVNATPSSAGLTFAYRF